MTESSENNATEGTMPRSRGLIWVGLVLLVVVAVVVGAYFYVSFSETRHLEEARTAIALSDWETAHSSLELALDTQPAFIRQHVNEAIALRGFVNYQMGDWETGLADMNMALAEDSDLVDLSAYRSNINFNQQEHELAFEDGSEAMVHSDLLPDHLLANLHANQTISNYQLAADKAVVADVKSALALSQYIEDEKLAELYAVSAISAHRLGDLENAQEDTRTALSFDVILADELLAELYANQAGILFQQRQYNRAIEISDLAFEYADFQPDDIMANLYRERSRYYYDNGDLKAAVGEALQAVSYGEDLPLLHALQALQSYQQFDDGVAMDEAKAALALDDQNALAHRIRGILLAQQGDVHSALEHLDQAKSLDPDDLDAITTSVQMHLELNDEAAAEADLGRAVELAPNAAATLWAKALVHVHNYEYEAARTVLDQAIVQDANRPQFYTLRSRTFHLAHEIEDAEDDLNRALALNPDFLAARAGILENNRSHFDYQDYETDLQELVDAYPNWTWGYAYLANYHRSVSGDLDQAALHADKVVELSPELAVGHIVKGQIYLKQDENEQALAAFERAIESDIKSIYARAGLVDYYLANDDFDMAMATVEEMVALSPEDSQPRVSSAYVHTAMGDLENAWTIINQVLVDDPENPYALVSRADINYQVGNWQDAMIDLSRAMDGYPHFADALLKRAEIHFAQGELESARQYADQTLDENQTDGRVHGLLSDIAFAENDLEEALLQIDLMIEKEPGLAYGYLLQGIANAYLGRFDDAHASYAKGLDLAAEDDYLSGLLAFELAFVNFTLGDKEQGLADLKTVLKTTYDVELLNDTENLLAYPGSIPVIEDGRFLVEDEIQQFSVSYSQDWERMEDDPESGYVLSLWFEDEDTLASVDMYLLEWPLGVSMLAGTVVDALYEPGTFNSLSLDDVEMAGGNGLVRQYELILEEELVIDGRHYYAVQDGVAVLIVTETSKGDYDKFAEEFEAVAASFRFLP